MSSFDLDTNQKKSILKNINFEAFYRNFACHVSRCVWSSMSLNVDVFEKGDISIVWGAGMVFQLFKFLKRSNLGYMVLKIEYVSIIG